jgi:hypothetical protein
VLVRIKPPRADRSIDDIAYGESVRHRHHQRRDAALRRADRNPVPAIDHAGSWQIEIGHFREKPGFLRADVALFRAGLDQNGIRRTKDHYRATFTGGERIECRDSGRAR